MPVRKWTALLFTSSRSNFRRLSMLPVSSLPRPMEICTKRNKRDIRLQRCMNPAYCYKHNCAPVQPPDEQRSSHETGHAGPHRDRHIEEKHLLPPRCVPPLFSRIENGG